MARARKPPIPVTVVAGPRGAGKTRLVNRLLASPDFAGTAVILNDFGATALAGAPVAAPEDDVVAFGAGCVCCSVRGALSDALENLLRDLDNGRVAPVSRLVIEAAATADPAAVIMQIAQHPYLALRFHADGIVAAIDAARAPALMAGDADAVRQLAMADVIAVTGAAADETRAALAAINPLATIVDAATAPPDDLTGHDGAVFPDEVFALPPTAGVTLAGEAGRIRVFAVSRQRALPMAALDRFLEFVGALQGRSLMRLVGLVAADDGEAIAVEGIGELFTAPMLMPADTAGTRFLVVARDFDRALFEGYLDAFLNEMRPDTPDRAALTDNPLAIAGFSARPGKR